MLIRLWKKMTYRNEDTTDYRALQQYVGEHMPGWDNRGVPGPQQNAPEQPQQGFANDILHQVDPDWRPR